MDGCSLPSVLELEMKWRERESVCVCVNPKSETIAI